MDNSDNPLPLIEPGTPWSTSETSYAYERACRVVGGLAQILDGLVAVLSLGHLSSTLSLSWAGYWTQKRHGYDD